MRSTKPVLPHKKRIEVARHVSLDGLGTLSEAETAGARFGRGQRDETPPQPNDFERDRNNRKFCNPFNH